MVTLKSPWVFCDENLEVRQGTPFSADGHREYTREFYVYVDNKDISSVGVCSCPALPRPFTSYITNKGAEFDALALLTEMAAKCDGEDWSRWIVTCKYTTRMPAGGAPDKPGMPNAAGKNSNNNPELEPPDISWGSEVIHRALASDRFGDPFYNSASRPYKPAPQFEFAHRVLNLTRNELNYDSQLAEDYCYALNSDKFLGADPGGAQCLPVSAKLMFKGPIQYWRVSYKIRFARRFADGEIESFQPKFLDEGVEELIIVEDDLDRIIETRHQPIMDGVHKVTMPVALNGGGRILKVDPKTGKKKFVYNTFQIYPYFSFKRLIERGMS